MMVRKIDTYLVFILFVIAFYSAYNLLKDSYSINLKATDELVATITNQFNTVKLKRAGYLAWNDAYIDDHLTYNDQIYTHKNSSTEISLLGESIVSLSENTLFKIGKAEGQTEFYLDQGIIHTKFNFKSKKKIKIHLKKKTIEINSKDAEISVVQSKGKTKLSVLKGSAELTSQGKKTILRKDSYIKLDQQTDQLEIGKEKISLLFPPINQTTYFVREATIDFEIEASKDIDSPYQIEIAQDADFNNIIATQNLVNHTTSKVFSKEGQYFWRVINKNLTDYPIGTFRLEKIKPPQVISPDPNSSMTLKKVGSDVLNTVNLMWQKSSGKYQIEIFTPDNTKEVLEVNNNNLDIKVKQIGEYAFRVRKILKDKQKTSWGKLQKFYIKQAMFPYAPQVIAPQAGHEYIFYNKNKMNIELKWKPPVDIPTSYKLIVTNINNNQELINKIVPSNYYKLGFAKPGEYSWKVQMIDKWLRVGPFNESKNFTITLKKITRTLPKRGHKLQLARPDQKVNFEWDKNDSSELYTFQVAKEDNFKKIIHTEKNQ